MFVVYKYIRGTRISYGKTNQSVCQCLTHENVKVQKNDTKTPENRKVRERDSKGQQSSGDTSKSRTGFPRNRTDFPWNSEKEVTEKKTHPSTGIIT